ncbi:beta-ketoacyl reductase, partial [Streptomyces sp. NPDC052042]|uniref:beta-ketoacyl reductase n=1 Tax=Streptomyces sp. NPDC052042 TaxID=3365683 RepID=UPI0037CECEEA
QSLYAAANAHLDALAQQRHTQGQPTTSIAWGLWGGGGMGESPEVVDYYAKRGLAPMAPDSGIEALERALALGDTNVTVADVDWEHFITGYTAYRPSRLISDIPEVRRAQATGPAVDRSSELIDRLSDAVTARERNKILVDLVRSVAAEVLGHDGSDRISHDMAFKDLGFDSLAAVKMRTRLREATGLGLPATVIFDHPTVDRLAAMLLAGLTGPGTPGTTTGGPEPRPVADDGAIDDETDGRTDGEIDALSPEELIQFAKTGARQ